MLDYEHLIFYLFSCKATYFVDLRYIAYDFKKLSDSPINVKKYIPSKFFKRNFSL
ncbi:MAG: hypothetical protein JWQ79_944 [Mucilaginibacter sp.]|nr:hypothetical protein [Mucilaginibacter sp.]